MIGTFAIMHRRSPALLSLLLTITALWACSEERPAQPEKQAKGPGHTTEAPTQAASAQQPIDGARAFRELSCAACHGDKAEGGVGPRLAGRVPSLLAMREQIRKGAPPMPAFDASTVSDAAIAAIREFLLKQTVSSVDTTDPERIDVPAGVDVERMVGGLPYPVAITFGAAPIATSAQRVLYVATHGRLFPRPEKRSGAVVWLDPQTRQARPLISGIDRPNGLLWLDAAPGPGLLVSSRGRVDLYRIENGAAGAPLTLAADLPAYGLHQNNGLALGPDGRIYLGMGTQTNADPKREDRLNGTILAIDPQSKAVTVFATGLRNPFDLAFSPSGDLFATDNGMDPPLVKEAPEELLRVQEGSFHGHPYFAGELKVLDPPAELRHVPPLLALAPHSSANGLLFYTGDMFPALKHQLLIAEFGSYLQSWRMAGRRISRVALATKGEVRAERAESWATGFPGRPLDLAQADDGSIWIADFEAGAIYRFFASERVRTRVKPSFDCARAKTVVEHAICGDPTLSRLDGEMVAAYRAARDRSAPADLTLLRDAQRQWLRERDRCAEHPWPIVCLKTRMIERANQLAAP